MFIFGKWQPGQNFFFCNRNSETVWVFLFLHPVPYFMQFWLQLFSGWLSVSWVSFTSANGASMKTNGSQINGCYFHRTCIIWSMSNFVENVCFLDFLCPVLTTVYTIDIFLMRLFIFPSSSHKRTFSLLHFLSAGVSLVKFLKRCVKTLHTLSLL